MREKSKSFRGGESRSIPVALPAEGGGSISLAGHADRNPPRKTHCDYRRATGAATFSGLERDRRRRPPERPPAAAFVGLQVRAFTCPQIAAAPRTATARPGGRSLDNSVE